MGFENWTKEKVEEHNRRVATGRNSGMNYVKDLAFVKHLVEKPKVNVGLVTRNSENPQEPIFVSIQKKLSNDLVNLNKLERRFYDVLMLDQANTVIWIQAFTLKLANMCRYTPDFVVLKGGKLVAYETKGWMRDDAQVKLKVAARQFPIFEFILVTHKKGQWIYTPIKP